MNYYQLLKHYIEQSGLSHREISRQCKARGTPVSQAYISQIVKRDVPPASDEVNRVIATVTGGDPEALIIAAYKEKAPVQIRELLDQADSITSLINKCIDSLVDAMVDESGYVDNLYRDLLISGLIENGMVIEDEEQFMKYGYQAKSFLKSLDIEAKLKIFTMVVDSSLGTSPKQGEPAIRKADRPKATHRRSHAILRVPVLRRIHAKQPNPLMEERNIVTWIELANYGDYQDGELFFLTVQDDSMAGSRICNGDKVLVKIQPTVENGEIAVVNIDEQDALLRRIKKVDSDLVLLYPDNPHYKPLVTHHRNVRICGKVIQVRFNPS
ncbi:hypothetical protein LOK74_17755 [Brevibacillus humidisoli]|uniref:LexA family protein n=1 Tax=Brevibacillus humidisoli TaxID=2895522 RepID=UPI001E4FF94C|nr:S24 family peptidase [Brevibacillus humidisoli]UFJ39879.1 hypothetical protein LOK74_17755 [Brevibacillus humidisoli]